MIDEPDEAAEPAEPSDDGRTATRSRTTRAAAAAATPRSTRRSGFVDVRTAERNRRAKEDGAGDGDDDGMRMEG